MSKVRVHNLAVSLDGYVCRTRPGRRQPLGVGGPRLHEWVFETRPAAACSAWRAATRASTTGSWPGETSGSARRSWGATCSARSADRGATRAGPAGGATTRRITTRLRAHPSSTSVRSRWRAGRRSTSSTTGSRPRSSGPSSRRGQRRQDRRRSGTIQQHLRAGLIDEMHVAIVPVLLGGGERSSTISTEPPTAMTCAELVSSPAAAARPPGRIGAPADAPTAVVDWCRASWEAIPKRAITVDPTCTRESSRGARGAGSACRRARRALRWRRCSFATV